MATKRPVRRLPWKWIARAASSLPVPDSPVISTVTSLRASISSVAKISSMAGLRLTMLAKAVAVGELAAQVLDLVDQPAALERLLRRVQQLLGLERLGDVVDRALAHRLDGVLDAAVAGDHDHVDVGPVLADVLGERDAVAAADAHVDQRQREVVLGQTLHGVGHAGDALDLVGVRGEQRFQLLADQRVVVDDQQARLVVGRHVHQLAAGSTTAHAHAGRGRSRSSPPCSSISRPATAAARAWSGPAARPAPRRAIAPGTGPDRRPDRARPRSSPAAALALTRAGLGEQQESCGSARADRPAPGGCRSGAAPAGTTPSATSPAPCARSCAARLSAMRLGVRRAHLHLDRRDVVEEQLEQAFEIVERRLQPLTLRAEARGGGARRVMHALQQIAHRMLDVVQDRRGAPRRAARRRDRRPAQALVPSLANSFPSIAHRTAGSAVRRVRASRVLARRAPRGQRHALFQGRDAPPQARKSVCPRGSPAMA